MLPPGVRLLERIGHVGAEETDDVVVADGRGGEVLQRDCAQNPGGAEQVIPAVAYVGDIQQPVLRQFPLDIELPGLAQTVAGLVRKEGNSLPQEAPPARGYYRPDGWRRWEKDSRGWPRTSNRRRCSAPGSYSANSRAGLLPYRVRHHEESPPGADGVFASKPYAMPTRGWMLFLSPLKKPRFCGLANWYPPSTLKLPEQSTRWGGGVGRLRGSLDRVRRWSDRTRGCSGCTVL